MLLPQIGGKTAGTSHVLTRLSGTLDVTSLDSFYSSNNFMIVRFTSDSSIERDGFEFVWSSEPQLPAEVEELDASDVMQTIESADYGMHVLANTRERFVIRAMQPRDVVSLQVSLRTKTNSTQYSIIKPQYATMNYNSSLFVYIKGRRS